MSASNARPGRIIGFLVLLFVLLFAGVLFLRYSPWGKPETVTTPTTETAVVDPVSLALDVAGGRVAITLRRDLAPEAVERIAKLAEDGFYDGLVFHRVIEGFMAQTGDPTGTGSGGSDLPDLPAEFTNTPFTRGAIGMARTSDPNSANSQFFIMFDTASNLNGQYTYVGSVTSGMEFVDAIKRGDGPNGQVDQPDKIISLRVTASDAIASDTQDADGDQDADTTH